LNGKIVAVVLALLALSVGGAYLLYAPGRLTLSITDPPPQPYDSSISAITVTFTRIEIHSAGAGNDSGWHTIITGGTVDLMKILNVSKVLGTTSIPAGKYTEIRFSISQTIIIVSGVNVDYTVPSANQTGFKVPITGGGLQVVGGLSAYVQLDLAFKNSDIINNPQHVLSPVATATVK